MNRISLFITSDDPFFIRGLSTIFSSEEDFNVLGGFSLAESTSKAVTKQPDAILLDLSGNTSSSEQFVSHIKEKCPFTRIIALVEEEHHEGLPALLDKGIDGFLSRRLMRGCLVKTVEIICRTGLFCVPGQIKKMVLSKHCSKNIKTQNTLINQTNCEMLTRRENEILQLMAKSYSNRQIAERLFISEPTVKTHVSNILRKLGQSNRAQAIVFSYKIGLVEESIAQSK